MLASWGLLLPLGVVLARFFKKEQGKIAGKPFWFAAHRACQSMGVVLMLAGFAVRSRRPHPFPAASHIAHIAHLAHISRGR